MEKAEGHDYKVPTDGRDESSPAALPPSPPPNGGRAAWLQVLGSFMICFNNWGIVVSYGNGP